ncbi:cytosolic arginine sensor for mTORC1 subunit 2-like [Leptonychotes weddellii]|uniref:Cytosolic arginine sensor for mTORC1 subunit 2-like n=1 Tax=Leptonychotes weddellii TaxID=9713 RepID=A0A7F8RNY7_LEPWE|nr:cytosolic arginine sensor for mTORC1 subunit 2-like [Leptonychotes weddellii]
MGRLELGSANPRIPGLSGGGTWVTVTVAKRWHPVEPSWSRVFFQSAGHRGPEGRDWPGSHSWPAPLSPSLQPALSPARRTHQSQARLPCVIPFPPPAELPSSEHLSVADATWLALNVVSGGGSFSSSQPIGVTKIAKSVIAPLADQNISVFMLSTYQTDFILVRERDLPFVTHTLSSEFTILRVVNGETVAAENLGITNGFVKPKMVQRPVIHPLSSPSNRFCVTSLDPDTLPAVATLLMDVMFYSNGVKDPMAAGEDCGHIRFFSFSLIEGYISLVMDVQTQQRFPSNLLFTSASGELWKMVRIGGQPLGFDECGIVAQISEPLAAADIPAYYISTFKFDHALVPEENISAVISALKVSQAEKH